MSVVVDAIEGVVDAVDKYVVQPIKNDPLTFVATVAGAAFLGPAAAGMLGTSATIGAGVGAAIGNTAAGLAQGESFDEAIKGGALAGVTTWAGGEIANQFGSPSTTSPSSSLQQGISSTADKFGNAGLQTTDDILSQAAKASADDYLTQIQPTPTNNLISPAAKNWGVSAADDTLTGAVDDSLFNPIDENIGMAGKGPNAAYGRPSSQLPNVTTTDAAGNVYGRDMYGNYTAAPGGGESVYTGQKLSGMGGQRAFDISSGAANTADDAVFQNIADTNQSILNSPTVEYGTGDISPGTMNSPTPSPQPTTWDKVLGYGKKAYNWAVDNPMYSVPLALAATSMFGQDKPPSDGSSKDQIGSSDFYEPLDLYRMNRGQLGYQGDIYSYGTQGGEHDFFSPTVYEPIKYAEGGDVQPPRDEYGYYTYGQIPRTMRKFAKGGLSALANQGGFDGRSDDIPAVLSDGEFVVDAETVALLGNGSSKAGANKLEQMRQAVRKQKGGALSQGKFSPDAKSPLEYLRSSKRGRG